MSKQQRGSDKMMTALLGQRDKLSKANLKSLLGAARKQNAKLLDWHIYGQPGDPDAMTSRFQVEPANASAFISAILDTKVPFRVEIFPFGIENPGLFQVAVQAGRERFR